jgi:hypothetical protein
VKIARALRLAKDGIMVSLAHPEPQVAATDVGPPGVRQAVAEHPFSLPLDSSHFVWEDQLVR